MTLLILGVALWSLAHLLKRVVPGVRQTMGRAGRGIIAILIVASVVMIVHGYAPADGTFYWGRSAPMVGINNLLMLFAVYFMAASIFKSRITAKIRHPQLTAVKTWAIAHLLVNGDTASFVLFGGLLVWAVLSVILINKAGKPELRVPALSMGRELVTVAAAVAGYGAIAWFHLKAGYPVFG